MCLTLRVIPFFNDLEAALISLGLMASGTINITSSEMLLISIDEVHLPV